MGYCGTPGCTRPHCDPRTPPGANRPSWISPVGVEQIYVCRSSDKLDDMKEKYRTLEKEVKKISTGIERIERYLTRTNK